MNQKKLTSRFLAILSMIVITITSFSCTDTETTNTTGFTIYYYSLTDIGPSMTAVIEKPTYVGSEPTDFVITGITFNGEPYTSESFVIDSKDGSIRVVNSKDLPVGLYSISVGCSSNGNYREFKDAVQVKMLPSVPDGIKVEPNYIEIDFEEVGESKATAKVVTEGEHVTINGYAIADGPEKEFFNISTSGVISITTNEEALKKMKPGLHKVSLKLTTLAGEGIFADAITFNLTSKPIDVTYNAANKGIMEKESETNGQTEYISPVPTIEGSTEEVKFSLVSIIPEITEGKVTINETTGVISIAKGHGITEAGNYEITVKVANKFAPEGVEMPTKFMIEVVDEITPISGFEYAPVEIAQYSPISVTKQEGMQGTYVTYSFVDLDPEFEGQLNIDPKNGKITAKKNNAIPVGTHEIKVQADNSKGTPTIVIFRLTVTPNPNNIEYIYYGNNLGLDKTKEASQYRIKNKEELGSLILTPETNLDGKNIAFKWSIATKFNLDDPNKTGYPMIDEATGVVKFSTDNFKADDAPVAWLIIEATAGEGDLARTLKTFVAFDFNPSTNAIRIEYTPFVFKVNPRTGGTSTEPTLIGVTDLSKFIMDYRRSFRFQNLEGPKSHKSGAISTPNNKTDPVTPADPTYFMNQVWRNYYGSKAPNYGARGPMSYYDNIKANTKLSDALGYVDPNKGWAVTINPNKWHGDQAYEDGEQFANGIMTGQMTYETSGNSGDLGGTSKRAFPLIIWFDENF
ncbi:surface glycan-binding family protein [Bacteroides zhangwenhongii]|uniref:surface glycan-binding family protein n=1 Tax=Bacteroides zhangwenhongii TaxID=2650157 RepID=UPI0032BFB2B7